MFFSRYLLLVQKQKIAKISNWRSCRQTLTFLNLQSRSNGSTQIFEDNQPRISIFYSNIRSFEWRFWKNWVFQRFWNECNFVKLTLLIVLFLDLWFVQNNFPKSNSAGFCKWLWWFKKASHMFERRVECPWEWWRHETVFGRRVYWVLLGIETRSWPCEGDPWRANWCLLGSSITLKLKDFTKRCLKDGKEKRHGKLKWTSSNISEKQSGENLWKNIFTIFPLYCWQ